jgi:hypothetical protein
LTQPVERRATAVIERIRVGAVFEQDLDRLRKCGLHCVVQRGCAVVAVVDARPVAEERGDGPALRKI